MQFQINNIVLAFKNDLFQRLSTNHVLFTLISQGISLQKSTYTSVGNHLWARIALLNLIISASIRDTSFDIRKPHIIVYTEFVEAKAT